MIPRRTVLEGAQCLGLPGELTLAGSQQWTVVSCSNLILYSRQVQKAQSHLHLIVHSVATCNSEARGAQESLAKMFDQLLLDRTSKQGAEVSPQPMATHPGPDPKDLVFHMQELCNDMKLLAFDLQDNNRLIERLHRVPPTPEV